MTEHSCCACFTHNNLPCCNDGHPIDWTGAETVQWAWDRSPLLASVKAARLSNTPAEQNGDDRG